MLSSRPASARRLLTAVPDSPALLDVSDSSSPSDVAAQATRARAAALEAELDALRRRLATAEADATDASSLRARLDAERHAREAAERAADASERQCELLSGAADGEESFEAVLAQDLAAMRDAYEARLAQAHEGAREAAAAHRKAMRAVQESAERERRAAEARARSSAALGGAAASGALTAR